MEFDFRMRFKRGADPARLEELMERLGGAGCDDAVVGIGRQGYIALDFTREAQSESDAILSALRDVQRGVPNAELVELILDVHLIVSAGDRSEPTNEHDFDELWGREIDRRASELDAGTVETIPWQAQRERLRRSRS